MDVIVVGAGPAGMMAAIKAAEAGHRVTIYEKNEKAGKKLFITGKGRCNLTNASDTDTFIRNVVTNERFLYSAVSEYNQSDVMSDFESSGLRLKVERGQRVFPVSDHSSDVIRTLEKRLSQLSVKFIYNTGVTGLIVENISDAEPESASEEGIRHMDISTGKKSGKKSGKKQKTPRRIVRGIEVGNRSYTADMVILATGGNSYQSTGSTGDGYRMLEKLGIDIKQPRPCLVPIETVETCCRDMMGLSLKNVTLEVRYTDSSKTDSKSTIVCGPEMGEMLFTHFGVSGPLVLSASSYISKDAYTKDRSLSDYRLYINLKPALDEQTLDSRLLRIYSESPNKEFKNSYDKLLPRLMIPVMVEYTGINPEKKLSEITRLERHRVIECLRSFELRVKDLRDFNEAIVTGGGVSVKEINPKSMELKSIKGLRVAGELIDCDALTGGFNLQIAWSTGYVAGTAEG